ncbi:MULTISPECIES: hypothetical protein [Nostocales]|uniref:Uncharacterized protein n=3 Tax=Nostocales TaxID=1161 RepID=A0A8S9SX47_9CYAN|nr:hypothetical protein [Tolypothrix bouteillei]KAF3884317.1 hypothetical protein DA73_0400001560 [Tolypothrix bouteillei VB521301]
MSNSSPEKNSEKSPTDQQELVSQNTENTRGGCSGNSSKKGKCDNGR